MNYLRVFILLIISTSFSNAQNVFNLNSPDDAVKYAKVLSDDPAVAGQDLVRFRELRLNPALQDIEVVKVGDRIVLDLFSNKQYNAVVEKINRYVNGSFTIVGKLEGLDYSYCYLSTSDDKSYMTLDIPDKNERFKLVYNEKKGIYYLKQINPAKSGKLEGAEPLVPPAIDTRGSNNDPVMDEEPPVGDVPGGTTISVMVVYTPAAQTWADTNESGINNLIASLMAKAQQSHDNSNTQVNLQLVHSELIQYVETDSEDDLTNLTGTSDGYMDEVHTLRNTYCADLVQLIELCEYTGGHAWVLNNTGGTPTHGFSLTRVQQASWSFTGVHEWGHNMGCGHHRDQFVQAGPALYGYSAGWRWTHDNPDPDPDENWCSLMTYESGGSFPDGIPHTRVAHFSNPDITYDGDATGHAAYGDNARTIRETRNTIAGYRTNCTALFLASVDNNFSNPSNWLGGTLPPAGQNIIIAPGVSMLVDVDFTCGTLTIGNGADFSCGSGNTLLISNDVIDGSGRVAIELNSALEVSSSIEISQSATP